MAVAGGALLLITLPTRAAGPPRNIPTSQPTGETSPTPAATTAPAATATAPSSAVVQDPAATQPLFDWLHYPTDPLGYAGASPIKSAPRSHATDRTAVPLPDRWRIGWTPWDRYGRQTALDAVIMNQSGGDSPYTPGNPLNPFDRNVLKGDYPIWRTPAGDDVFFSMSAISDTFFNDRKLPTPSGVSASAPGKFDFFGDGSQLFVDQKFLLPLELFQGYSAFRPVDWLLRITPVFDINYLELQENNGVNINTRAGRTRQDSFGTLQEAFLEYHLGDVSPNYDIIAMRAGRQLFISDFRGFVYDDIGDGLRLFGNVASNRVQYNLAYFQQNDKDTNSGLAELNWRDQQVLIANCFIQDFFFPGYTTEFSFHWNHDQSDREFDDNGFQVIPDLIGSANLHNIDAYYLGWTGDGHIGRVNVDHAFYYVFGHDDGNPLAGRAVDIGAYMGALELSVDIDWFRPKLSFLYASGDRNATDGKAGGFDGITDNPQFAGGATSFYQSQAIRLLGVNLVSERSFYNDLASTKGEGQSNYVNPGTILLGAGFDAEITPKLRFSFNANSIWFADTSTLQLLLNQPQVHKHVGFELDPALQYRPFLNNNVILTVGGSVFFPGRGFEDIYGNDRELFQFFTGVTLTF